MQKDKHITKMMFRKFKNDGSIIALFPYELYNEKLYGDSMIESYMHLGQHSGVDYLGVLQDTRPATKAESRALKAELKGLGYNIKTVFKRTNRKKKS